MNISTPDDRPVDGVSLLPMIEGREKSRSQPLPFMHKGNAAWIERDLKYIYRDGNIVEIYNLHEDRFEENNLVSQYSEKAKEISNRIMQWNFSCKKSHGGADYSTDFTPVNQWRGIDKLQHK